MFNKKLSAVLFIVGTMAILVAGCSGDDPAAPTGTTGDDGEVTGLEIPNFTAAIYAVAPDPYVAAKDMGDWTGGDYPLLSKVIGNPETDEPMSLYRNLHEIDRIVSMIENLSADADMDSSYSVTENITDPSSRATYSVDITYHAEGMTVSIPLECRTAMGIDSIPMDHYILFEISDIGTKYHLGFGSTDESEWALAWTDEGGTGTNLFYASHDKVTGVFSISGAFWKTMASEYTDNAEASWIYNISTSGESNQDFIYNMAWYSYGEFPGDGGTLGSLLGCVNGSGNKDARFALSFHQYTNGDWVNVDTNTGPFEQLFGPGYVDINDQWDTYGPDLIHVDDMFVNSNMPTGMFSSPYETD